MTLSSLTRLLADNGISEPDLEARLLFCHFFDISPAALLAERGKEYDSNALQSAITRRLAREPLAYILGEVGFYEESYLVSPACLIPRSDTELLVEHAIHRLPKGILFADFCTGSGCIAISVLAHRPDLTALAVDLSEDALALAAQNAARIGVADRISFVKANLLDSSPLPTPIDYILSNPPYIASDVIPHLAKEVHFEPHMALDGGADGLIFYRAMLSRFDPRLFLFEIGYDQAEALKALARDYRYKVSVEKDLGGRDRLAVLERE